MTINHSFFTFGVVTSLTALWQKYFGPVEVSLIKVLFTIEAITGIVAGVVNYLTLKGSLKSNHGNNS